MKNMLEKQFDPLDSEASRLANGFDPFDELRVNRLTIKKIREMAN